MLSFATREVAMHSDLDSDVSALRQRVVDLQSARQRTVAQFEAAQAEVDRLLIRVREEFGASSLEELETLLDQVDMALKAELEKVSLELSQTHKSVET